MAKHLILSPSGEGWRLPADTNLGELEGRIADSMNNGDVVFVTVETQDNPLTQGRLVLNGRVLESAALVELPEPDQ